MKITRRFSLFLIISVIVIDFWRISIYAEKEPFDQEKSCRQDRQKMVETQIKSRGVKNKSVISAMLKVPRHKFVPLAYIKLSYTDRPLPIGYGQTISQPYIVALMTELADPKTGQKVLEIGTGSGYQAAILAELGCEVYTIEILRPLAEIAEKRLKELGYKKIKVRCGDGFEGWQQYAPFDAIIVTAAPKLTPETLLKQLKIGGRMVIPVGEDNQTLKLIKRTTQGYQEQNILPVRFVPMIKK